MGQKKYTQAQQVIDTLRKIGGYATLGDLYHLVDTKSWATKTPNESIRRIVQQSGEIFKIQPGLWALEECREEVMRKFDIEPQEEKSVERFTHGYYQGLIIEIGNMKHYTTYVPAQDQNRKFIEKPLKDICSTIHIPAFSYKELTDRARTVDVIWFNERNMPDTFFEVEHSTDIQNSITKFCDLQDFNSRFLIVAPQNRKEQFDKVISRTAFKDVKKRVSFSSYESIYRQYELMCKARASDEFI
ncbi:MAG: hypothetical protein SO214_01675 [Prevotella pectinovora]|jgi:hypothetical protein|uniref:hypothetical protein n=1 Tax=Prevotella pectinovora TaxID=1602169 RepID=UPI0027DD8F17|nr:hypothetical protein [Prevotella pectinovora]MDY4778159.1 hypothetical protein [Prevotella pectinovora]